MKKLLIIYNKIWPYRERIFEMLNKQFELTVAFSDPKYVGKKYPFNTLYLPGKKYGPFYIHSNNLNRVANNYDAIIGLYDIRWLKLMLLSVFPFRKYTVSFWGIGVTASYKNRFDSKNTWDKIRYYFGRKAESLILYSEYPIKKHMQNGVKKERLFVANNTTEVYYEENKFSWDNKINFLFVGTLYPQKGFEILLEAYNQLSEKIENVPVLDIIGDGPEYGKILDYIKTHDLTDKIILHGGVYNPKELSKHYNNAIACISPNQAGLSVLTSMGNSTIFVTEKNAITGGEIFNILPNITGILYEGGADVLTSVMQWIIDNKEKVYEMSMAARAYYLQKRTPEHMAKAISDAVTFALNIKTMN